MLCMTAGGAKGASFGKKHSCGLGFLLLFDAVDEADAGNKPAQQVVTVEAAPVFLRHANQLKDHRQGGVDRTTAFGLPRAMAHLGEGALDRVGGA